MRVFEIMTREVQTVRASLNAAEAWELMRAKGIHHLVVVNGRIVVGVLSHRDAGGRAGAAVRDGKTVGDLMSRGVVTAKKTDTVRRAANLMRGHSVGCLPILDGSKLVGIITTADLLDVVGGAADRPGAKTRGGLSHKVPHRKQTAATGVW